MKRLTIIITILCSLSAASAQKKVIDGVVWIVGENSILKSEVEEQRQMANYNGVKFDGDPNCLIAEQIAVQQLFLHQASLDSIVANEGQVLQKVHQRDTRRAFRSHQTADGSAGSTAENYRQQQNVSFGGA